MKTFIQFLHEDFNGKDAMQFQIEKKGSSPIPPIIFFEEIPERPFSLQKYMETFNTKNAKDSMQVKNDGYRGIVFDVGSKFLIFVWSEKVLHNDICKNLDDNKEIKKYPTNINYLKTYHSMYTYTKGKEIKEPWCFTFTYTNNNITSNLSKEILQELQKQIDIKTLFKFSDSEMKRIIQLGM